MQDMATMQQLAVKSPNPAPPIQDATSTSGDEIHQETSRTDKENRDDSHQPTAVADEKNAKDHVIKRDSHIVDLKCQNNNEITENNENLATKHELSKTNGLTDDASDASDSEHDDGGKSSDDAAVKMETSQDGDADDRPDSEMKYVCPICDKILSSQHDFTLHIRSHNNDGVDTSEVASLAAKGYACKICSKVLSSSSSLDRHVLVHSGERPFKCRVCAVAFTTNGNMHRHMRTHSAAAKANDYESDASTDSGSSLNQNGKSPASPTDNNNGSVKKRRIVNESDKTSSSEVSPEANNNKRKMDEIVGVDGDPIKRRLKGLGSSAQDCCGQQKFQCPVCEREDFASLNVLETHLESTHPEYKIRCRSCDLDFKNHRVLNLHRFMVHHDKETSASLKASVLGFKDLTFMDFSSEKFPHIARAVCEQKLHVQASSAQHNFQCGECGRAFPCGSALAIHRQAGCEASPKKRPAHAVDDDSPTDLSQRTTPVKDRVSSDEEEEEKKREDFFAGLDLQNKSVPTSPSTPERREKSHFESAAFFDAEPKDLADIQSMISVTNAGGLRLQDLTKSPVVNGSLTPSDKSYSDANEEEQQDCFAAEFRKMKLKGEFPCRLCSAVFPNLRALKGHNRAHLVNGNVFRCNMCPYANADKAILIRHMRSHNGDRPYECALCNYAFTTKANCERHLRNRHSKLGRDEVKKSIIYHPSEDPTNDVELQAKILTSGGGGGGDAKRALTFNNSTEDLSQTERYEERYQSRIGQEKIKISFDRGERFESYAPERRSPGVAEAATMTSVNGDDSESDDSGNNSNDDARPVSRAFGEHQRINVRHRYSPNNNSPLDLSMDVLDLSKKATPKPVAKSNDLEPQDLSKKTSPPEYNNNVRLLKMPNLEKSHLQAQLMARPQSPNVAAKLDHNVANFYAANPHPMFINNNGFPFPAQPFLNPYFMAQQHPMGLLPELIRGLQMSGGTMLDPMVAADTLQHLHQQAMAEYARKEMKYNEAKADERPPQEDKVMTNANKMSKQLVAPQPKAPRERDNASVKMVIKNGVLMPKQKQRRYRTERPFFCEHCSARFTLRSNMERHIKQQHPEFWTQRQRGNVAGGRRNPSLSSHSQENSQSTHESKVDVTTKPLGLKIPNHIVNNFAGSFDVTPKCVEDTYETKEKHNMYTNNNNINNNNNNNNTKPFISDEVKHAISQQLKSKLNNPPPAKPVVDEPEEDDLVIDEEDSKTDDKTAIVLVEDNINKRVETPRRDASFEEGYKSFKDTFFRGIKSELKDNVYRPAQQHVDLKGYLLEAKERGQQQKELERRKEESVDLASVSRLIDNATNHAPAFQRYFRAAQDRDEEEAPLVDEPSDDDEEGLVAPSDNSGSDENRSDVDASANKKKSAYSLAPNRVSCPYCHRKFPWSSSLRRHVLTHTGQKPFKCAHCPLLFTTKSNCDRHLLRKHANTSPASASPETSPAVAASAAAPHSSYTMRNVPERPYKCNFCPSSTFSTLSNLNKHLSAKHPNPLAPKVEDAVSNEESSEEEDDAAEVVAEVKVDVPEVRDQMTTSDLPFKCHLCEGSYGERQEALEHIKENHPTEFVLLMSKGALESGVEDNNNGHEDVVPGEESLEQLRGKFPDYANRKVMCAFCLRRFWSAEDLRRHMRTHTGERPFSCDICRRRFTLKHSMLRHRKKHSATDTSPPSPGEDDNKLAEAGAFKAAAFKTQHFNENNFKEFMMKANAGKHQDKILKGYMASQMGMPNHFADNGVKVNGFLDGQNGKTKTTNHNNNNVSAPGKGVGSRYIMENPWPGARDARSKFQEERKEGGAEDETDLIGNLLGIQDKSIIDKMLVSKSADDAAKLLGVGTRE